MKHVRTLAECLFVVLFQTAVLPLFPFSEYCFDPAIPYVLYLGLFNPVRFALFGSLVLGLLMDGLSGAPFGLHATLYLWIAAGVRQMTTFIRVEQTLMIQMLTGLGILFKETVLLGVSALIDPGFTIPADAMGRIAAQGILGAFAGPFLIALLRRLQAAWEGRGNGGPPGSGRKQWLTISKA